MLILNLPSERTPTAGSRLWKGTGACSITASPGRQFRDRKAEGVRSEHFFFVSLIGKIKMVMNTGQLPSLPHPPPPPKKMKRGAITS